MSNPFADRTPSLSGPATDILPVTPNDGVDLAHVALALYVETAGTVSLVTVAGGTRSVGVASNSILPVGVRRVRATGTTATGIHALVLA
jgi:subtilisin family serine protease